MAKGTKAFRIDGEDFAEVCHMGSAKGTLIVDISMTTFELRDAKRFRRWLDRAIAEVEADRKRRRPGAPGRDEGKERGDE
jgi:hypothetical protein